MSARLEPLHPPYPAAIKATFDRIMPPGIPPLALFTTLARDARLWEKFRAGSLLDKGHLTLRQREIVIDRVAALSGCEYEWGVHATFFGERAGLNATMLHSLVHGGADDPCWSDSDRCLLRACDQLHTTSTLDDTLWNALVAEIGDDGALEVLMLAGFYRTVSTLANTLRLPLETFAARFPVKASSA